MFFSLFTIFYNLIHLSIVYLLKKIHSYSTIQDF
nr:MAG TPA: hypothetical protein [Caudoviricetes sp.]